MTNTASIFTVLTEGCAPQSHRARVSYTSPSSSLFLPLPLSPSLLPVVTLVLSHVAIWAMTRVSLIFSYGGREREKGAERAPPRSLLRRIVSRARGDVLSVMANSVLLRLIDTNG